MTETILICPHCNQEISKKDLEMSEHSWANVEKFLNQEKELMLKNLEEKVSKTLEDKFKSEKESEVLKVSKALEEQILVYKNDIENNKMKYENEINNIKKQYELDLEKGIKQKEIQINEANLELKKLKEQQELLIQNKLEYYKNGYLKEISDLKMDLLKLQENNKSELLHKEIKYQEEIKNKEIEISEVKKQHEVEVLKIEIEIENKYINQIEELKIANAQNKVLQSKRKGENFEHEVEGELRKAFGTLDIINKISDTTNEKKADYLQIIRNNQGFEIGKIVYEVKNAEWKDSWEKKLATDVANNKTKYGILVATSFNDQFKGIPFKRSDTYPNIWITDSESFVFIGQIIRKLIQNENNYLAKINSFNQYNDIEIIKEYENKKNELDQFWSFEFPKTQRNIETQLTSIHKVKNSLEKNAFNLEKAWNKLKIEFKEKIEQKLKHILGPIATDKNKSENKNNDETELE